MKPTVPGIPASASIAIVIGQASHGLRAPEAGQPRQLVAVSPLALAATITAKAAMFMNR